MLIRNCAALAALALLATQPAAAATITVVETGTLSSGFDQTGRFGTASTDLTGVAFSLTQVFDTTLGGVSYNSDGYVISALFAGTGSLTINGVTETFAGDNLALWQAQGAQQQGLVLDDTFSGGLDVVRQLLAVYQPSIAGPSPTPGSFSADCSSGGCKGNFFFSSTAIGGPPPDSNYFDFGFFDGDTYEVTAEGTFPAVPEPASWAMMILGFGMIGGALRRSRAVLA